MSNSKIIYDCTKKALETFPGYYVLLVPIDDGKNEKIVTDILASHASATPEHGLRWVKASERNPTKEGYYFSYRHHSKSYPQVTFYYLDKGWSSTTYEWLSESPTPSPSIEAGQATPVKRDEEKWDIRPPHKLVIPAASTPKSNDQK